MEVDLWINIQNTQNQFQSLPRKERALVEEPSLKAEHLLLACRRSQIQSLVRRSQVASDKKDICSRVTSSQKRQSSASSLT